MDVISLKIEEKIFRVWYYFRLGYSTYLSFVLGMFSFITTTYFLAINNIPSLSKIFPNMIIYTIFLSLALPPTGTIIGWLHMKRSLAYTEQIVVGIEASPFTYKIQPGIAKELSWPYFIAMVDFMESMLGKNDLLTDEDKAKFTDLRDKAEHLLDGGSLGLPDDLRLTKLRHTSEDKK